MPPVLSENATAVPPSITTALSTALTSANSTYDYLLAASASADRSLYIIIFSVIVALVLVLYLALRARSNQAAEMRYLGVPNCSPSSLSFVELRVWLKNRLFRRGESTLLTNKYDSYRAFYEKRSSSVVPTIGVHMVSDASTSGGKVMVGKSRRERALSAASVTSGRGKIPCVTKSDVPQFTVPKLGFESCSDVESRDRTNSQASSVSYDHRSSVSAASADGGSRRPSMVEWFRRKSTELAVHKSQDSTQSSIDEGEKDRLSIDPNVTMVRRMSWVGGIEPEKLNPGMYLSVNDGPETKGSEACGSICITLRYEEDSLQVQLLRAKNLRTERGAIPRVYCKLRLYPSSSSSQVSSVPAIGEHSANPIFKKSDRFKFPLPQKQLESSWLRITVLDAQEQKSKSVLGHATVLLKDVDLTKSGEVWRALEPNKFSRGLSRYRSLRALTSMHLTHSSDATH